MKEIQEEAKAVLSKAQEEMKKYADKRFARPYRIKKVISSNTVKLKLPSIVKVHPVVNVSRI